MAYIAYKFEKTGNGLKERLHIRTFKTMNDLGDFLCKQTDNKWKEDEFKKYPQKSGIYAFAGGQYHNVKSLDSSVLAHI